MNSTENMKYNYFTLFKILAYNLLDKINAESIKCQQSEQTNNIINPLLKQAFG